MTNYELISIDTKPTVRLCYRFYPHTSPVNPLLVVFINGLILPQVSWSRVIGKIKQLRGDDNMPALLTYDRFGQGQTEDHDPQDAAASDPMHGHDCLDVATDLRQIISKIAREKMGITDVDKLPLVLVSKSVGGCIARLYAQEYPGTVAGQVFLDCLITNTDLVSVFPDPDEPGFDPHTLPEGITVKDLYQARDGMMQFFHPNVGSTEGLSRKTLRTLLPHSDAPALRGPDGRGPFITVVSHEPEEFAEQAFQLLGRSKRINMEYLSPEWQRYHEGLLKTTERERAEGPIISPGSSHFIQKDNPEFVAEIVDELLYKIM